MPKHSSDELEIANRSLFNDFLDNYAEAFICHALWDKDTKCCHVFEFVAFHFVNEKIKNKGLNNASALMAWRLIIIITFSRMSKEVNIYVVY